MWRLGSENGGSGWARLEPRSSQEHRSTGGESRPLLSSSLERDKRGALHKIQIDQPPSGTSLENIRLTSSRLVKYAYTISQLKQSSFSAFLKAENLES